LTEHDNRESALEAFQQQRKLIAKKIVDAASTSARWYDDFRSKMDLPIQDFAFSYLTRSGRIDLQRLRKSSPKFMSSIDEISKTGE